MSRDIGNRPDLHQGPVLFVVAVWLAEIGVYGDSTPALSRSNLVDVIEQGWPMGQITKEHRVAVTTVRVELHRHGLFDAHRQRDRTPSQS